MSTESILLQPVARVRSPRPVPRDDHWGEILAQITLEPGLDESSLTGIEDFSHLEIVFYFHGIGENDSCTTVRHPRGNKDWPLTGIFAQRARDRPNKIGLSIVELIGREGRTLTVRGLDAIDGTPVLDIKPVMKEFLPRTEVRQPSWATELMKNYW